MVVAVRIGVCYELTAKKMKDECQLVGLVLSTRSDLNILLVVEYSTHFYRTFYHMQIWHGYVTMQRIEHYIWMIDWEYGLTQKHGQGHNLCTGILRDGGRVLNTTIMYTAIFSVNVWVLTKIEKKVCLKSDKDDRPQMKRNGNKSWQDRRIWSLSKTKGQDRCAWFSIPSQVSVSCH